MEQGHPAPLQVMDDMSDDNSCLFKALCFGVVCYTTVVNQYNSKQNEEEPVGVLSLSS